jgi:urea transport system permease protein
MRIRWTFCLALFSLGIALFAMPAAAQNADIETLRPLVNALGDGGFAETEKAISNLAATGDPRVAPVLEALRSGDLYVRKSDGMVVGGEREGREYAITDPLTSEALGKVGRREADKIRVNNSLRRIIDTAVGGLTLRAADPRVRSKAAAAIFQSQDTDAIALLEAAVADEQDAGVKRLMEQARAAAIMASDRSDAEKRSAIEVLIDRGDQETRSLLLAAAQNASDELKPELQRAVAVVENNLAAWSALQNVWYGLSLGSVLLLAAIGLAITFGVMGVINMAHGEMVMLGAYTTFVVQEIIRTNVPGLFDYSLAIAVPLAFLVAGAVGIAIERSVIRWLYGRALETLLATWGISLILQQAVRSLFGPTNREVGAPSFMSGAFDIGQLTITYNRLWILLFSFLVLALLALVLRKTRFGLQMRAVTQNRAMASSMGIRTSRIDALTFGLGSGIAGIAGVALSQIDNVSPNLGQSYIVDSFMVVVFGGVGNLWGTLVGAMSLGVANKFLEPYAGAVLGKILVLVFIILFIQKRPRGLFALKGRAVEA